MTRIELEFSRPLQVDRVPALGSHESIAADAAELTAVARRLNLPALHALSARMHAKPWRGGIRLEGKLVADLDQLSVVSLETFRSTVEFSFERYFMPPSATVPESEDDIDTIEGGEIDMGEVVVETLALELDPYPRLPGEQFSQQEESEEPSPSNPFTILKKIK